MVQVIKERIMLKIIAMPRPEILNPGIKAAAKSTIEALMIKVNKPKVKILIGKVKIRMIGRITALTAPNMSAANKAMPKFRTSAPGISQELSSRARALISQINNIFI